MELKKGMQIAAIKHDELSNKLFNTTKVNYGHGFLPLDDKKYPDVYLWFPHKKEVVDGWINKFEETAIYEKRDIKRKESKGTKTATRITFTHNENIKNRIYTFEGVYKYSKEDSTRDIYCYKLVSSEIDTDKYKC